MSYVKNNLLAGESIVYSAKTHWFAYVPGAVLTLMPFILPLITESVLALILSAFALPLGLVLLVKALIGQLTTELAVTSKRVIAKAGIISRKTIELNHSKVESLSVDQGIFGRIFDFGTVAVNGTGGGKTLVPNIGSPLEFRREAMQAIDNSQATLASRPGR